MKNLRRLGKIEAGVLVTIIMISGFVSAGSLGLRQYKSGMIHEIVVNDWTKESINELSNNQIYCTSLVYDQFDTPHVFYITTNNELKRSFRTPIGWFEDIVDTRVVGRYVSAKIDSNGMIHVAYVKDGLMCISGDQTGWQKSELVDPNLNVIKNSFVSLDIDSNDMPHIAYYDGVKKDLLYARKTMNNIWEVSTIDSVGDVGKYCSIVIDSRAVAFISYYDATNKDLKIAAKQSYIVFTMIADSDNYFGLYSSIAVDQEDYPHIVHSGLRGVKHTFIEGSNFKSELISIDKTQCFTPSIVIDDSDKMHVGFSKTVPGSNLDIDIMYASKISKTWVLETAVDGVPFKDFAYGIDINLDENNNPAMSFVDIIGNKLEFVFK